MKRRRFLILAFLGVSTFAAGQTASVMSHTFTAQDWASLRSAHAVAIAPNSGAILYQVSFGGDQGPAQTEWWMADQDGTKAQKVDIPKDFTPMGFAIQSDALYGTCREGDLAQFAMYSLRATNPEATPTVVATLPRGMRSVVPSPDGSRYAILFDPRAPDLLVKTRTVVEPDQTGLYVLHADGTGGNRWCVDLTRISEVAWSPDGASLAVLSSTPKIGFHYVRSFIDICDGENAHRVAEIANVAANIAWASNGEEIVFIGTSTHVLQPDHVWTVAASGGSPTDRTPGLQGSAMELTGDPNGNVWVAVNRGVRSEVDQFSNDVLTTAYTWPPGSISGLPVSTRFRAARDNLAFTVGDPEHTSNVAVAEGGKLRKITEEGNQQLRTIEMGIARLVRWTSKEGTELEGIATFPAGYVTGRKYPFLVMPHGGPESNDTLILEGTARVIAGLGYVVLQPEYRGSTGYGSDFMEAIYQHRGSRMYSDVDSATDYAITQGWADPSRLAIFGWSAGGFLTSWTITQTGRYHAAIDGAGVTDWASFIWTSDAEQTDYDARWPEEDPDAFRRFSPVDFAAKVTTPLLILHGAADTRIPLYQSLEFFQALVARGKTARMVTYPGSPHFPVLWQQKLDVMHEIAVWLARYNR